MSLEYLQTRDSRDNGSVWKGEEEKEEEREKQRERKKKGRGKEHEV